MVYGRRLLGCSEAKFGAAGNQGHILINESGNGTVAEPMAAKEGEELFVSSLITT